MRAALPLLLLNVRPVPYAGAPRLPSVTLSPAALSAPALSPSLTPSLAPLAAPGLAPLPAPHSAPTPERGPSDRNPTAKPALDAAGAAPAPAESKPAEQPAEKQAAEAAARFDGSQAAEPAPVAAEAAPLPPVESLRVTREGDKAWLGEVMAALSESRTGRRVLADVEALARRRGRPVIVDVAAISNNAEVRYDSGLLVMDKNLRKKEPHHAAPILAHELTHVLQKSAESIPVDALEMEIEAYTVEARVWDELGVTPKKGSFARTAKTRLQKDPDAFFAWLAEEYSKNRVLHGTTMDSYVEWLELQREKSLKKIARYEKRIAEAQGVIDAMSAAQMPREQIDAHRREEFGPAMRDRRDEKITLAWIDRDLQLLSTPEGQARFREYSRGVIRRARAMRRD